MKKRGENYRDAVFVITEERTCPIYNIGEELKVVNFNLTVPLHKPGCLILAQTIVDIVTSKESYGATNIFGSKKLRFDCGGCDGLIHFEFQKDKEFTTLQMKLLSSSDEKARRQQVDKYFGIFRNLKIFESLDDAALADLTGLLEIKIIPADKVVLKRGDPGSALYIILNGQVAVKAGDGSKITEMGSGDIFGEMSLLTGEPVTSSIHTIGATQVASLSVKNFKHALKKYPVLQLFLLRILVDRAQIIALRSGNIISGMTGDIIDISTLDLLKIINFSKKTGSIDFILNDGKAMVFFREGEIVHARYLKLREKNVIYLLLGTKRGHFSYSRGIPSVLDKQPPIGNFSEMIKEGMQKADR